MFKHNNITLLNCDCMDYMAGQKDNAFDLAIVDPPYGISQPKQSNLKGYDGRKSLGERLEKNRLNTGCGKLKNRILNNSNTEWDNSPPNEEYFKQLARVAQNRIIWGGNYFNLPPSRGIICWDKVQPWDNFSQIELAWTSFDNPARLFKYDNRTGDKIHPTQKPVALYRWLLQNYAKEGDRILDTHSGSASIAIACEMEGFELVCCELDKDYYEAAVKRFRRHISEPRLFKTTVPTLGQPKLFR